MKVTKDEDKELRRSLSFRRLYWLANSYAADWVKTTSDHAAAMEVMKIIVDFLRFASDHKNDDL